MHELTALIILPPISKQIYCVLSVYLCVSVLTRRRIRQNVPSRLQLIERDEQVCKGRQFLPLHFAASFTIHRALHLYSHILPPESDSLSLITLFLCSGWWQWYISRDIESNRCTQWKKSHSSIYLDQMYHLSCNSCLFPSFPVTEVFFISTLV